MRAILAVSLLMVSLVHGGAVAAECPPGALGVARTIVVDPREHARIGAMQYGETLPLNDREVVLTFDDGPVPRHTGSVLETLASECTKATFFMVGQMANAYPAMVRRVHDEGHTIANHSQTHPFTFSRMSVPQAAAQIEGGFASIRAALGDPDAVAPFFRIPGLLRQDSVEQYLAAHGVMTWSVDVVADDWTHINAAEIARRAVSRLEARGKGVLLLHDIHEKTAVALPVILQELKERGFKIVHVVPAAPDRPKTPTTPEQWAAHAAPAHGLWPRVVVTDMATSVPALTVPSPASFGVADPPGPAVALSLAPGFDRAPLQPGEVSPSPVAPWPRPNYSTPSTVGSFAVPAAQNFQYARVFTGPRRDAAGVAAPRVTSPFGGSRTASPPRLFGHQL
jgi:peptidoglycan/xylan/chitin deacetylase (PgdA/CDA1 family)